MIGALLRLVLPPHLDWLGSVVDRVVALVDESTEAARTGWDDDDDARLGEAVEAITRELAHGIRTAAQAVDRAPRRVMRPRRQR